MGDARRRRASAVLVLGLLAGGCVSESRETSGDVTRGDVPAGAIVVEMQDNAFVPDELTARPGERVVLEVVNHGRAPHNLVVDAVDLSTGTMPADDEVVATITMPESPVEFVCTFHPGMDGRIDLAG